MASCKNSSVINNTFRNFGDAAVRAHTATNDSKAINSENIRIANNLFYNVTQVTTTQAVGNSHGGTKNVFIENNIFEGLRASIKCASRKPVNLCFIRNNHVKSSSRNAVEIASVSDVTVENNIFENVASIAMNIYGNENMNQGYQWGNLVIQNNIFRNAGGGIRIANIRYDDGSQFDFNNIKIANNIFDNLGSVYKTGVVGLTNSTNKRMNSINVTGNFFRTIKASRYIGTSAGVSLSASNNLAWPLQFSNEASVKAGTGAFPTSVRNIASTPSPIPSPTPAAPTPVPPPPSPAPKPAVKPAPLTSTQFINLEVVLSADQYQGAPVVTVFVGGKKISDIVIHAKHSTSSVQKSNLKVPASLRGQPLMITYNNDIYGGPGKDRNVYIHSLNFGGKTLNLSKAQWTGFRNRYVGTYDGRLGSAGSMTIPTL